MAIATLPIPLTNGLYRNVDGTSLNDRDAELQNCFIDDVGFLRNRPGISLFQDLSATVGVSHYPVNGVFWWQNKEYAMIACYGKVLKLTYASGYITVTDMTTNGLNLNAVPTFATDGTYAFFTNGGRIIYTDGSANTAFIADGDCPTTVTHIAWLDGYLLANDGTNKFFWSDVNTPLSWNALNYASAAGDSDPITALKVFQREIYLFGANSLEVWANDGVTPFTRQAYYNVGCIAPHSIVYHNQAIYWLSNNRQVVKMANGAITPISTAYDKDISMYSSVSDCRGFSVVIDGRVFLVFTFAGADKTLVYSLSDEKWAEWTYYNENTAETSRWLGECVVWSPSWGIHIVGDRASSKLGKMSADVFSDYDDPIRVKRLTGHISYGSSKLKRSEEIRFRAKRGVGQIGRMPKMAIRWNTDNAYWSNERHVSLGDTGQSSLVCKLSRLGTFHTKQYEIVVTDSVPVAIGEFEEDITMLR